MQIQVVKKIFTCCAMRCHSVTKVTLHQMIGRAFVRTVVCSMILVLVASCNPKASSPEAKPVPDLTNLREKAEGGNAQAQADLGNACAKGFGVQQDYSEAAKWYRQAAEQGHAGAQASLGELCEIGQGVPLNEVEAAKWYRRAAEQGHTGAQYSLAALYVQGKGVPKDEAEAVKWYREAADQGMALAQYVLGKRYAQGQGVARDVVEAFKWFALAAKQGMSSAVEAVEELKPAMSPEQIREARRRAEQFVPEKASPPVDQGSSNP